MTAHSELSRIEAAARDVRRYTDRSPRVALVLGSGLGRFADELTDATSVPYSEITGMPVSQVAGHAGNLVLGDAEGVCAVAMQGRVHLYEGHSPADVVFGLRLMLHLGAERVIITNAAGGIADGFAPGDLMVIEDHINLTGRNCLVGLDDERFGSPFVDMSTAYDAELRQLAHESASGLGVSLQRGVYAGLLGPSYETPAEIGMLRTMGAHAVGMSTVLECIAARHMGARVLGLSCITNFAAGLSATPLSHQEVKETADRTRERFVALLRGVLGRLA